MTGPEERWEAIARWVAGEASPAEAAALERWLAEDPARAELLSTMRAPIERLRATPPKDLDVEAALRRVHARMEEAPRLRVVSGGAAAPARRARWLGATPGAMALRAAAAAAVLLAGGLLVRQVLRPSGAGAPVAAAASTWRTAIGQRDSVVLPDGTHVLLGPGSVLALGGNFARERDVTLTGEALFSVTHDAARPFRVHAGGALIEDVGTRFDVRADERDRTRVVVVEGAVAVAAADSPARRLVLRAGSAATLAPGGRVTPEQSPDPARELAWTQGELVFRGAPVSEVAASLRRWYGIELRVADPALQRRHLTTSFGSESRDRVLQDIALALGARLEMHGDTAVLISPESGSR